MTFHLSFCCFSFLSILFQLSILYSIEMCHVPIRLELEEDPFLKSACEEISPGAKKSLHMTLVFMEVAFDQHQPFVKEILSFIRDDPNFLEKAKRICLKFQEFSLLGPYLVSNYAVVDPKEPNLYVEFIHEIRREVRKAAEIYFGEKCLFEVVYFSPFDLKEICKVDGQIFYAMDIRRPKPHVTLKKNATKKELAIVNKLLNSHPAKYPRDITVSLTNLNGKRTVVKVWENNG